MCISKIFWAVHSGRVSGADLHALPDCICVFASSGQAQMISGT